MKELSSFSCSYHMSNNLRHLYLIFFFAILLIEDAILFVAESDAAEEIR
jgi:hypothetical protein